jgi:hypothetical protein
MSKKVKSHKKNDVIKKITACRTKKGKIKGGSKKETRMLKGMCGHHYYNRKGKKIPTFITNGDYCYCTMCKGRFKSDYYKNEEIIDIIDNTIELNNQMKFIAIAVGAGDKAIKFTAEHGSLLIDAKKLYIKLTNVARKQGTVKEKKKKHAYGSSMYGSWGPKR